MVRQTVTGTTLQPTADLGFGQHFVWVRALDPAGVGSSWSSAEGFYVGPQALAQPVSTFATTPTFGWTTETGNVQYEIYVNDGNGTVIRDTGLTSGSWTPSSSLPAGHTSWWIRPTINGSVGRWGERQEIFIGGRTAIVAPAATTSNRLPEFRWETVTGAGSYDVYVLNMGTNVVALQTVNTGATSLTFSSPFTSGNYRVWVMSISANGQRGFWSGAFEFSLT